MKIRVETTADHLMMEHGKVKAIVENREYIFELSDIEEVLLITSDLGPFFDDLCLAIRIDAETAIFIMSAHPCFRSFLFDQLGKSLTLDHKKIIEASTCIENNVFVVYQRKE